MVDHTAEVGLRLEADSYEGLFRQAAEGLLAVSGLEDLRGPVGFTEKVSLSAQSAEELLVDWINELLPLIFSDGRIPAGIRFDRAGAERIEAEVRGPTLPACTVPSTEIEAATYHGLKVERSGGLLRATVILDV